MCHFTDQRGASSISLGQSSRGVLARLGRKRCLDLNVRTNWLYRVTFPFCRHTTYPVLNLNDGTVFFLQHLWRPWSENGFRVFLFHFTTMISYNELQGLIQSEPLYRVRFFRPPAVLDSRIANPLLFSSVAIFLGYLTDLKRMPITSGGKRFQACLPAILHRVRPAPTQGVHHQAPHHGSRRHQAGGGRCGASVHSTNRYPRLDTSAFEERSFWETLNTISPPF